MFDLLYDSKLVIDEAPVKCETPIKQELAVIKTEVPPGYGGIGPVKVKVKKRKNPPSGKTLANPGNAPTKETIENEVRRKYFIIQYIIQLPIRYKFLKKV